MKGSESLWNEEELLTQMEQMQDQIEQLQQDRLELLENIADRENLLTQQERQNSSEISKLQSALLQAQKKLQEQSDQIVRLSEADLILQDNEKLKEENGRLRSEKEETERKAAREVEAGKERIRDQEWELCRKQKTLASREDILKKGEQKLANALREQEETIRKKVDEEKRRIGREKDADMLVRQREFTEKYDLKEHKLKVRIKVAILYGVVMTALLVVISPLFGRLKALGGIISGWAVAGWNILNDFADGMALNSLRIPGNIPHRFLYHVIHWGVIGVMAAAAAAVVIMVIHWLVRKHRKAKWF